MAGKFPALPASLTAQLAMIPHSGGVFGEPVYFPCAARLKDGTLAECVYFSAAKPWFEHWGVWPADDEGKRSVSILDVVSIEESPHRLPAKFANTLYEAGESGMGYTLFVVEFADGSSLPYGAGNAVDFITYPPGMTARDVVRVVPHAGRTAANRGVCPEYAWCLFDGE
jgi:hypothetical protein